MPSIRYGKITDSHAEVDADTGCTVCDEDQVVIEIDGVAPFRVCRIVAPQVTAILQRLSETEFPFFEIEGYRVGQTRGDADENGNRTRFSNHSFGIALDINPGQNGLYDRCPVFGPTAPPARTTSSSFLESQQFRLYQACFQCWSQNHQHFGSSRFHRP